MTIHKPERRSRIDKSLLTIAGPVGRNRQPDKRRNIAHRRWVKRAGCILKNSKITVCWGPVDFHHHRRGTDGGLSVTPHDKHGVCLCRAHHSEGDAIGWISFERKHGIDIGAIAEKNWALSPYRKGE